MISITPTVDDFLLLVSQHNLTQLDGLYENETVVTFCNNSDVSIILASFLIC